MTQSRTRSISFTSEYEKEYEYFLSIPNRSKYVCELIRRDMETKNSPEYLAKQVEMLLMQMENLKQKK